MTGPKGYVHRLMASALIRGFTDAVRGRERRPPYKTTLNDDYNRGWDLGAEAMDAAK